MYKPKICLRCGKEFIPTSGSQKYCPECRAILNNERSKKYYQLHKKERAQYDKEKHKQYYQAHKQEIIEKAKQYYQKNKQQIVERKKRYYQKHKEEVLEYSRQWKLMHRDKYIKDMEQWREKHREYMREYAKQKRKENPEYMKEWQKNNPEKIRQKNRKQQAKRRQLGFIPLNNPFKGCEGHHINKDQVIYIPKELHHAISHNVWTGKNMNIINKWAIQYLLGNYIIY